MEKEKNKISSDLIAYKIYVLIFLLAITLALVFNVLAARSNTINFVLPFLFLSFLIFLWTRSRIYYGSEKLVILKNGNEVEVSFKKIKSLQSSVFPDPRYSFYTITYLNHKDQIKKLKFVSNNYNDQIPRFINFLQASNPGFTPS
jgi:hypothetical protein